MAVTHVVCLCANGCELLVAPIPCAAFVSSYIVTYSFLYMCLSCPQRWDASSLRAEIQVFKVRYT